MRIMREIALFSGKIYTAGTNFTRPPVVTVATNLNSGWRVFDRTWIIVSLVGRNYSSSVDFDIFLSSWCDHSTNQKFILKRFIKSWLKQNTLKYESIQFLWRFENCFEQLSKNTKATRIFMCEWFLSRSYNRTIRKNQTVWMIFCARQKTWGWWSF